MEWRVSSVEIYIMVTLIPAIVFLKPLYVCKSGIVDKESVFTWDETTPSWGMTSTLITVVPCGTPSRLWRRWCHHLWSHPKREVPTASLVLGTVFPVVRTPLVPEDLCFVRLITTSTLFFPSTNVMVYLWKLLCNQVLKT